MKPDFRICPQCSTRNRLDKEFCVKCGEPLEGVAAGDPAEEKDTKGKASFFVSETEDKSVLIPLIAVLLLLFVALAAWRYLQATAPATGPETTGQSMLIAPESPPPPTPVPAGPGVEDYSAGVAALRSGDYKTAVTRLRAATKAAPNQPNFRIVLGEALEKSGSPQEGLAEYEAAAGLDATSARYAGEWAKALNRAGRNNDAIRVYGIALAIQPENLPNLREVANLQMRSNNFAAARPHLEKLAQLQPDDLLIKQNLARAMETTNDLKGAAQQYRDILVAMPNAEVSRGLLSEVLMKDNLPAEALKVLDAGLAANPSSAALFREKGRVYDRMGNNAGAIAAYREYLRLAPTAADARVFKDRLEQLSGLVAQ
ncbi:MAG: tetratricopeptide repeat protein [Vicinamibacteria bacterium]|nr:tetratricopeptide repeat protein [Vicinamibacteria bacterium]